VTDAGPVDTVVGYIKARKQYNEDQNGAQLERYFGGPPYGASSEALQLVLAVAMRAGLIEVVSQAARITSRTDHRLEPIFAKLPTFRAASFRPAEVTGPDIDARGEVAEWLHGLTGNPVGLDLGSLAQRGRATFGSLRQPCTEARSTLLGAGLGVPDLLDVMDELLARVAGADDELIVETMHERRTDLAEGLEAVPILAELVETEMPILRAALAAQHHGAESGDDAATAEAGTLGELLARARYGDDMAKIKASTTAIETAVATRKNTLKADLESAVGEVLDNLRTRYPGVEDSVFESATERLRHLSDTDDNPVLQANRQAIEGIARVAADTLDTSTATREVRHVRPEEVWSGPITSEEEMDLALGRLREAILEALDADTEVRFR